MERGSRKRSSSAGSEKMERVGGRLEKMEAHCSTGQSPRWAVVPMEEVEEEEEELYFNSIDIRTSTFFTVDFIDNSIRIKSSNKFLKYFTLNTSQFPPTLFNLPHMWFVLLGNSQIVLSL